MYEDTDQTISPWAGASSWSRWPVAPRRPGAQALGRRIGSIGPGRRADIVVLDVDHPDMAGSRGDLWLDQYVFVAGRRLVKTVLIGGVKLVDDCALCARAAIVSRYRKVVARIAGKAVI
jgi:hypothetical protein